MYTLTIIIVGLISWSWAIQYEKITVEWGEDVVLSCPNKGRKHTEVRWFLGTSPSEDTLVARVQLGAVGQLFDPLHENIASLDLNTGDLTIKRARFTDQAWYTCMVGARKYYKSLVVNSVPSVSEVRAYSSQSEVDSTKQNITFSCQYSILHSVQVIIWYFNEVEIFSFNKLTREGTVDISYGGRIQWQRPSDEAMTMILIGASSYDVGLYTCAVFDTQDRPHRSSDMVRLVARMIKGIGSSSNDTIQQSELKSHQQDLVGDPADCTRSRSCVPVEDRSLVKVRHNVRCIGLLLFVVVAAVTVTMVTIGKGQCMSHKPKLTYINKSPILWPVEFERGCQDLGGKYKILSEEKIKTTG